MTNAYEGELNRQFVRTNPPQKDPIRQMTNAEKVEAGLLPMDDEFFTHQNKRLPEGRSMIRAKDHRCPRCGGGVPNDERRGQYPGALSRTDNLTEVCSQCGQMEAFEQMGGHLMSQLDWRFPPAPGANAGAGKGTS